MTIDDLPEYCQDELVEKIIQQIDRRIIKSGTVLEPDEAVEKFFNGKKSKVLADLYQMGKSHPEVMMLAMKRQYVTAITIAEMYLDLYKECEDMLDGELIDE